METAVRLQSLPLHTLQGTPVHQTNLQFPLTELPQGGKDAPLPELPSSAQIMMLLFTQSKKIEQSVPKRRHVQFKTLGNHSKERTQRSQRDESLKTKFRWMIAEPSLTFSYHASCVWDRRTATLYKKLFIYLVNKYIV